MAEEAEARHRVTVRYQDGGTEEYTFDEKPEVETRDQGEVLLVRAGDGDDELRLFARHVTSLRVKELAG